MHEPKMAQHQEQQERRDRKDIALCKFIEECVAIKAESATRVLLALGLSCVPQFAMATAIATILA